MMDTQRADVYLVAEGHAKSRTIAQKLIAEGAVEVDGRLLRKPSEEIAAGAHTVTLRDTATTRYVSRGGLKLEAALSAFSVDVHGAVVADIGASTGGFTDCLLRHGAARVYAVDAGHGQLHPTLLSDPRVCSAEGVNARFLTPADLLRMELDRPPSKALPGVPPGVLPEAPPGTSGGEGFDGHVGGCVMDVSFISQTLLHPTVAGLLVPGGWFISLIKPQFELDSRALGKRGLVKSDKDRRAAVERVCASAKACGFEVVSVTDSPIEGGDGNREFLAYLRYGAFVERQGNSS